MVRAAQYLTLFQDLLLLQDYIIFSSHVDGSSLSCIYIATIEQVVITGPKLVSCDTQICLYFVTCILISRFPNT